MTKTHIYSGRYVCRAADQLLFRQGVSGLRRLQPIYQHDYRGGVLQDSLMLVEIQPDWTPIYTDTILRRAMLILECGIDDAIKHPDWQEKAGDTRTNSELYHDSIKKFRSRKKAKPTP
jgi:hypothetical protein